MSHPVVPPRQRWGLVVIFLGIAVLPPVILAGTEAGTAAWIWSYLFGVNSTLPSLHLVGAQVDVVAWAWAIFFGVVAVIAATDSTPGGPPAIELKPRDSEI